MHEWMKLSRRLYIQLPGIFHTILTLGWLAFHSRTLLADDDLAALLKWFNSVFNRIFEAGIQESLSFMNSMSFLCNSSLENELVLDLKSDPGRALMPGSGFWESWLSGRLARFFTPADASFKILKIIFIIIGNDHYDIAYMSFNFAHCGTSVDSRTI